MARLRRDGARYHHKRLARGEWLRSAYIITTGANSLCALIHDRMPVILDPADSARWVGEEEDSVKELKALLRSFNPERMERFPVSASVGSVKNNDPRRRARGGVRSCGTHRTGRT